MGDMRNGQRIIVGKPEGKRSLGRAKEIFEADRYLKSSSSVSCTLVPALNIFSSVAMFLR
jgi:hypothetical protein